MKLTKKIFQLNLSNVINLFSLFFLQYLISVYLTEKSFSKYSAIVGLCFILLPIINFGVSPYIIKKYFKKNNYMGENYNDVFNFLNFNSILILFIFFLISKYLLNIESNIIIIIFGTHLVSNVFFEILYSKFQYKYNYSKILFLTICFNLSKLVLIIIFIYLYGSINLYQISYIFLISSIIVISLYYYSFRENINKIKIFEISKLIYSLKILKYTYPFGINGIVFYLYYFTDLIIIYKFGLNANYTGNFSLSLSFIFLLYIVPTITIDKLYINEFYILFNNKNFLKLKKITNKIKYLFIMYAFVVIFFIIFFIKDTVFFLYQTKYLYLVDFVTIMSFSVFFRYLTIVYSGVIHTGNYLLNCSYIWLIITLIKIITNIYIVSNFDIIYVAYSFLLFEILVFVIFYFFNYLTINNKK